MPAITPEQFETEFQTFSRLSAGSSRFTPRREDNKPMLHDRTSSTGFDRHYIYHTAWAARVLAETRPAFHVDISSSLYFAAIASAFVPIRFYDYRPANLRLPGVTTNSADLLHLPFADRSLSSLSCMHVVEHVGLGRYGDPLDPDGDLLAMSELQRVVAPGGDFLFVVPIGQPRVLFNAHRIYAYRQIVQAFSDLALAQFALIPEHERDGGLLLHASESQADRELYACGCFWFKRPS
jgi:SAM-dependent methyltransferase